MSDTTTLCLGRIEPVGNPAYPSRLRAVLGEMQTDPTRGNVKRLHHERSGFRRRVGDWRLFFDLDYPTQTATVVAVERRTSTTYRKRH